MAGRGGILTVGSGRCGIVAGSCGILTGRSGRCGTEAGRDVEDVEL